jgi:hypothetical protein
MPFAPTAWLSGVSPFAIPVTVESTITEDPGQPALVEDVSENPNLVALRFYVPRGDDGADGAPGPPGPPGAGSSVAIGTVSALPYGSAPTVTNSGTPSAAVLDWQLVTGPQGPAGSSSSVFEYQFQTATTTPPTNGHIRIDNVDPSLSNSIYVSHIDGNGIDIDYILQLVPPSATLVLQKKGNSAISYTYSVIVTLALTGYVRYETIFVSSSGTLANNDQVILVIVNNAPPGEAATVNIGTVTQVPYSPTAITVTNSGTTSAALLDFTLCPGPSGSEGSAATIAVGAVTTGAPGTSAVVTNVGTSAAAIFDMTIPQGATGSGSTITINNTASAVVYRMLFTNATSGTAAAQLSTHATALTYNANTLALTNTGGTFACSTVTANLTGTASNAAAVTTASTVSAAVKYLLFSNGVGAGSLVQLTSTLANQLIWDASLASLTIGNGITGIGVLTCNTINCTTLNGTADFASQVTATATASAAEKFLCFVPNAGSASIQMNNAAATKIVCNPSIPSITMGAGVGGSGVITSNSFVGTLTGNASSATQITATGTATTGSRYLLFTPSNVTGVSDVQFSPTLATQIYVVPSGPSMFIGNGITGSGALACATITCTTMNGQATGSDTVETVATTSPAVRYITFTPSSNVTAANSAMQTATALQYNPGSALLTATNLTVSGTLTATVATSTNLAGGAAGSLPYQSAAGATAFLGIGTAGQILRSTGTVPSWATVGGFPVSFGGNASAAAMVLQYGLPSALFSTTILNSTLGAPSNGFVTPYACILVAAAGYSTTSSATATATIHVNGSATALTTIPAGQFTVTGARTMTLSSTTSTIAAGSLVEVRVNVAAIGNCMINLYIA